MYVVEFVQHTATGGQGWAVAAGETVEAVEKWIKARPEPKGAVTTVTGERFGTRRVTKFEDGTWIEYRVGRVEKIV